MSNELKYAASLMGLKGGRKGRGTKKTLRPGQSAERARRGWVTRRANMKAKPVTS